MHNKITWSHQSFKEVVNVCVVGVTAPDVVAELERPGDGMSPDGSLRYSQKNFLHSVLDGIKCPM